MLMYALMYFCAHLPSHYLYIHQPFDTWTPLPILKCIPFCRFSRQGGYLALHLCLYSFLLCELIRFHYCRPICLSLPNYLPFRWYTCAFLTSVYNCLASLDLPMRSFQSDLLEEVSRTRRHGDGPGTVYRGTWGRPGRWDSPSTSCPSTDRRWRSGTSAVCAPSQHQSLRFRMHRKCLRLLDSGPTNTVYFRNL